MTNTNTFSVTVDVNCSLSHKFYVIEPVIEEESLI